MTLIVKVSFPYEKHYFWHLDHSAPGRRHQWGDIKFDYNPDRKDCDAWVVWQSYQGLLETQTVTCPVNSTILVTREPPDILELPDAYLKQFGTVIAPDARIKHSNLLFQQFGQVWHIEKDYDELLAMPPLPKAKLISAVTSSKSGLPGQKRRLHLLERLKEHFGEKMDHYGRGISEIKDKWDAIGPYRYHITLENGQWPHYWTEKLADAYLGWCMPIYVGAPNISDYFPPESMIVVDPQCPDQAIAKIERAIQQDAWTRALPYIAEARQKIMHEYHLYAVLAKLVKTLPRSPKTEVALHPDFEFQFSARQKLRWRVRNAKQRMKNPLGLQNV